MTIGTFDGVHRGHRLVLDRLARRGRELGQPSVLVTFSPHPLEVLRPQSAPQYLSTDVEKEVLLAESPIDRVELLEFTPELAQYDATKFVDEVLRARFGMQELLVGHDHGFGRGRGGSVEVLQSLGSSRGFRVTVVPPVQARDGAAISSTAIRRAVAQGNLAAAADGLGRLYSVSGTVVPGESRGRKLGYRTLNLQPPAARKLLPPVGVYAVTVRTPDGVFGGMTNIGPRPTFGESGIRIEAHLFDADGDWYGQSVNVEFIGRLRDTQRFSGADALRAQLRQDEEMARVTIARGIGLY